MPTSQQHAFQTFPTALDARLSSRDGTLTRPTGGIVPGYVQANLCILPKEYAPDFQRYCALNPRPCPLLGTSEQGNPSLPTLGKDIDIRFDVPRYRVWENGKLIDEVPDIADIWSDDLVAFALGCSHSFEDALLADGLPLRHVEQGMQVPYYLTSIETVPSGPFNGPMVVSMRPFNARDAIRAIQITSRFPSVHGAPVHLGNPKLIGIDDLDDVETGLPVKILADEMPVFWACGVTPQSAIMQAKPPLAITHAPGHMLVTDLLNSKLSVF